MDDDDTEKVTVLERALGEYVALTCKQKDEDEFSEEVTSYESDIRQQVSTMTFENNLRFTVRVMNSIAF